MSWLPGMMFMHMLDDDEPDLLQNPPDPVEQHSTRCDAEDAPVVTKIHPPVTNDTPVNNNSNNAEDAPTTANSTSMAPHRHVSRHIRAIGTPGLHRH